MYGAVVATSRRLGVRHAPLRLWSIGPQYQALIDSSMSPSSLTGSPHFELRRSLFDGNVSFQRPPHAPEGRHVSSLPAVTQSQLPFPSQQSSTVGTWSPTWGMP